MQVSERGFIFPEILYEDNHLIAVNKRPSDIVQGDKTGDTPLSEIMKNYIGEKYFKPGAVFLGTVHRLDRPVSGALLFARTTKSLARMNELLRERKMNKTYWAIVKSLPKVTYGRLSDFIWKNEKENKSYLCDQKHPGAVLAELEYRHLASADRYHLLEVKLITGRHHQIRTQLAAIGSPIKGDIKYGSQRTNKDGSISLHSRELAFVHPVKNTELKIIANPPRDPLWEVFLSCQQSSD